jgi:hypothetical protein
MASGNVPSQEIDEAIARELFGLSQEQIDAWPWGVPPFSTERGFAASVVGRIWSFDAPRSIFEKCLALRLPQIHGGIAEIIFAATPDVICEAALAMVHECGHAGLPSIVGRGPLCHVSAVPDDPVLAHRKK